MFDVGFSELLIIAVVALLVLGPERLPKAARFAGLWVRRARAQWYSVKSELERELAAEELKRHLSEPLDALKPQMQALEQQLRDEYDGLDPGLPERVQLGDADAAASVDATAFVDETPAVGAASVREDDAAPVQGDLLDPAPPRRP